MSIVLQKAYLLVKYHVLGEVNKALVWAHFRATRDGIRHEIWLLSKDTVKAAHTARKKLEAIVEAEEMGAL